MFYIVQQQNILIVEQLGDGHLQAFCQGENRRHFRVAALLPLKRINCLRRYTDLLRQLRHGQQSSLPNEHQFIRSELRGRSWYAGGR